MPTNKIPWVCNGTQKYIDPATNEPRRCRQKLMFFDADAVNFHQLAKLVEVKCPKCHTVAGGKDFVEA